MNSRYTVASCPDGWSIVEDGRILLIRDARSEAVELGRLLAFAVRAAGGSATLMVQDEDAP